jgi:hypothetical protein
VLLVFLVSLALSVGIYHISQGYDQRYFKYDSWGYYIYLPSFLIYHDPLDMTHVASTMWRYDITHEFYQAAKLPGGHYVFAYTGGVAMMELPFFAMAHQIALVCGLPADGYSTIYHIFIICSGLFWGIWGLMHCFALLKRSFSIRISGAVCIMIAFGTGLYNYMFWENGMTHVYTFFLFAFCLRSVYEWYEQPTYARSAALGLAWGLIILIRPTNGLMLLPIFWIGTSLTREGLRQRLSWIISHIRYMVPLIVVALIPLGIQMAYWKGATNSFLFNPYGHSGLGFDFRHPHMISGLLSNHKGWLFYSPIVLLGLWGLMIRSDRRAQVPAPIVAIYLFIHTYIAYSWVAFGYGGCYGARPMTDILPILCFPMAVCTEYLLSMRRSRMLLLLFAVCCVCINIFQVWKYQKGYLLPTGYGKREIIKSYFNCDNYDVPPSLSHMLDAGQLPIVKKMEITKSERVDMNRNYSKCLVIPFGEIKGSYSDYFVRIEASGRYPTLDLYKGRKNTNLAFSQECKGQIYCWKGKPIYAQTMTGDTAIQKIVVDKNLVSPFSPRDIVKCYLTNFSANSFEMDTLRLYLVRKQ